MKTFSNFSRAVISSLFSISILGFMLHKLWEWFIVPTFDVSVLPIPVAVGFVLILLMFGIKVTADQDEIDEHPVLTPILGEFIRLLTLLVLLAYGYVLTLFM